MVPNLVIETFASKKKRLTVSYQYRKYTTVYSQTCRSEKITNHNFTYLFDGYELFLDETLTLLSESNNCDITIEHNDAVARLLGNLKRRRVGLEIGFRNCGLYKQPKTRNII
jgi:hypothetical protein